MERAEQPKVLLDHGGARTTETKEQDGITILKHRSTNDADYLTARIARDNPEVLEGMQAGEFAIIEIPGGWERFRLPPTPTSRRLSLQTSPVPRKLPCRTRSLIHQGVLHDLPCEPVSARRTDGREAPEPRFQGGARNTGRPPT